MLHVDAPGREDCAEQVEAADVHALMLEGLICTFGKPNAKARGAEGGAGGKINSKTWGHSARLPWPFLTLAIRRGVLGRCVVPLDIAQGQMGYD